MQMYIRLLTARNLHGHLLSAFMQCYTCSFFNMPRVQKHDLTFTFLTFTFLTFTFLTFTFLMSYN